MTVALKLALLCLGLIALCLACLFAIGQWTAGKKDQGGWL